MEDKMIGVILAAGKGTRMEPFSTHYPKPILPICNKPLLHYQIEMMKELDIEEIIIVIGHLGHEIAQALGDGSYLGVKIRYVDQKETLGIAHALGKLESYISSPFLLSLGDIFFVTEDLRSMKEKMIANNASVVLAVKYEEDPEVIKRNFTVLLRDDIRAKRVMEKPRHTTTNIKGCGLYLFNQYVFDAIRRTPRTAMRDEYEITDTIQIVIEDEFPVLIADVVKWDMNVTFPADVLTCNLHQLKRLGKKTVIGNSTNIHSGAKIENSVVGDGVVIQHPIKITNTVIFPYTVVTSTENIDRFIVAPEHQIDCRKFIQKKNN
ncbi:MAG: sugar phosphate nucleotidyltransferase [Planctomycetota bacterium]|jgi:dTDP-glucose pyrophosphorylase